MSNQIYKPLSVSRADFIIELNNLINRSQLPTFIIEPILKDIYNDLTILSKRQLEQDRKTYEEELQNAEE